MTVFSRVSVMVALAVLFLLAGLFGGPANPFDVHVIQSLEAARHTHPQFTSTVVLLTHAGSVYATIGLGVAAAAWLAFQGAHGRAALLVALVTIERLMMDGLKLVIGRPRPWFDEHPVITHSSSFPSGHSANTMAVFVGVALIAVPERHRGPALLAAIAGSVLVGATRPFLGVHWPSDVLGGWAFGLLTVAVALRVGHHAAVLPIEAEHDVVSGHRLPPHEDEAA